MLASDLPSAAIYILTPYQGLVSHGTCQGARLVGFKHRLRTPGLAFVSGAGPGAWQPAWAGLGSPSPGGPSLVTGPLGGSAEHGRVPTKGEEPPGMGTGGRPG